MSSKIAFTCGGTGGHVYPAIALAQELPDYTPFFLGTSDREDHRIVAQYGFPFFTVGTRNLTIFNALKILISAFKIFKKNLPHLLICTGGSQTLFVAIAAWLSGIPIFILEQNTHPGRTNRLLSFLAKKIILSFPESRPFFSSKKSILLGNPVRKTFPKDPVIELILPILAPINSPLILVIGGSQGALAINQFITQHHTEIIQSAYFWIHLMGQKNYISKFGKTPFTQISERLIALPYCEQMDWLYTKAEFIISRSGATTIAELIHYQKKAILVPFPFAKDNHQVTNATHFCAHYPGKLILEHLLNWNNIQNALSSLKQLPPTPPSHNPRTQIAKFIKDFITKGTT
jgi:UDP-N-acetylglucosamine--N-acetylmuramyl-(pentapeptide) pyrophosphoryl-undecaprenol N-acetylglucosamine transferase